MNENSQTVTVKQSEQRQKRFMYTVGQSKEGHHGRSCGVVKVTSYNNAYEVCRRQTQRHPLTSGYPHKNKTEVGSVAVGFEVVRNG